MQQTGKSGSFRKPFWTFVGVILLSALAAGAWYWLQNMSGRKAWQSYVRMCGGWVDSVDAEDFVVPSSPKRNYIWMKGVIPPPIADEKNFATHPYWGWIFRAAAHPEGEEGLLKELTGEDKSAAERWSSFRAGGPDQRNNWRPSLVKVRRADLSLFFKADSKAKGEAPEASPTLEEALALWDKKFEPNRAAVEELRRYLKERPECRYPIQYIQDNHGLFLKPLLPHLSGLRNLALYPSALALIHLARGESAPAQEDIFYLLDLADTLQREPFPISLVVRMSISRVALDVLWEGIEAQAWSAEQLQQLQERFRKVNFWNDQKLSIMGDRAAHNQELAVDPRWMEVLIHQVYAAPETFIEPGSESFFETAKMRLRPIGWYYRELLEFNLMTDSLLNIFNDEDQRYKPTELAETFKTLNYYRTPDSGAKFARLIIASGRLQDNENTFCSVAYNQFLHQAAEVACALERYRLANGRYPASLKALGELLPEESLPRDWVNDRPPQIRQTDTGYLLWSAGWDRKDDGGTRSQEAGAPVEGDWVWEISR